jgi:hypothetical protein
VNGVLNEQHALTSSARGPIGDRALWKVATDLMQRESGR